MKKVLLFLSIFCAALGVMAQTTVTMNGTNTVTGCNFVVVDHAGMNGDYATNRNDQLTIYSNNPSAACVQINILVSDFDVHHSDTLFIYDGPDDSSPLLGKVNNDEIAAVTSPNVTFTATVHNPSGALTLKFVSDGDSCGTGYIINTECVAPCQRVQVALDSVLSSHYPHIDDDGFYYIDVCPYDVFHIVAYGIYPDNNFSYNQNDQTSTFYWDLGISDTSAVGLNALDHNFTSGRGYDVSVTIEDSAGCRSTMPQIFRVRTSSNPIRTVSEIPQLCTGQPLSITTGYDYTSNVQVDTVGSEQITSLAVCDTIFLPDGVDCGNGCAYQSPVTFTSFSPTATVQSADDILYVRIKLEHSFIGDIYIALTCPNGQYVKIMNKASGGSSNCSGSIPTPWGWATTGSSGAYFGNPVDDSGGGCTPTQMGTPWNYCWSNNTDPVYGYQYAAGTGRVYEATNITNNHVDSTDVANMTNVYHPDQSFDNLIGCPLNGTWAVTVIDGYNIDNGYVTEWEMALSPELLPQDWSYTCTVDSTWLEGPGADGNTVVSDSAGVINYIIHVMDEFGCIYDTTTTLRLTQSPNPNIGEDFFICHNDMVTLDANYDAPNTEYRWNTGDETRDVLVLTGGEYVVNIVTSNDENTLHCSGSDTINVGVYESPMFNFNDTGLEGCAPLNIRFDNMTTPADCSFEWMILFEDGNLAYSSTLRSPSFEIQDPGKYTLYLKATTQDGCVDSIIKWNYINVNAQPIAEFSADPEISMMSENQGQVIFINYADSTLMNNPDTKLLWNFDDGETDSTTFAPTHIFQQWGDYNVSLRIETESGCASEITHTVVIEQDLIFPNIITPNGDNVNDVFAIENLNTNINLEDPDAFRTNRLMIYDRWGQKVYDAKNYDTFSRNGQIELGSQQFNGDGLSDGVYYYSFFYKGKVKTVQYNGALTIIR